MENLVEKAKKVKGREPYKITQNVIDLALAWKNDEVSIGQIQKALNIKEPNKIYAILARALKKDKPDQKKSEEKPTKVMGPMLLNKDFVKKVDLKPWPKDKKIGKSPDTAPSKY